MSVEKKKATDVTFPTCSGCDKPFLTDRQCLSHETRCIETTNDDEDDSGKTIQATL